MNCNRHNNYKSQPSFTPASASRPLPLPIRNIKTTFQGLTFKGLNECRMYVLLREIFSEARIVYEPESFELKSLGKAYTPDYGLILQNGTVAYVESKVFDVPLEDACVKLSALSLTGRPCILVVGYPTYFLIKIFLNGFGGKFVPVDLHDYKPAQQAQSFSPWAMSSSHGKMNPKAANTVKGRPRGATTH